MTLVDGAARTRFGPAGVLFTEALIALLAALLFAAVLILVQRRSPGARYLSHPVQS
jgi:hypothetical protein